MQISVEKSDFLHYNANEVMTMQIIPRKREMSFLLRWRDKDVIKVVSGVRRSGKSTLLSLFRDDLIKKGTSKKAIQSINFEDITYDRMASDYHRLYDHIKKNLVDGTMNYIFLDEIQHVDSFEKVVDALYILPNTDIYITGSNAYFLSGELSTLLSGRYVEIKILPLSFADYSKSERAAGKSPQQNYREYISSSSFPFTLNLNDSESVTDYLRGTYSTVILKDIVARLGISDVMMLESVTSFLFDSIGSLVSSRKIADAMTSKGRKIDPRTIEKYINALKDALLIYEAPRYNVKGKEILSTLAKYYVVDIGVRRLISTSRQPDSGHILENIVYLELLRRNYRVFVGQLKNGEIDFVAMKGDELSYYQVALTVLDEKVLSRELAPLEAQRDNYPKYLLTLDEVMPEANYNGIHRINALNWLLAES